MSAALYPVLESPDSGIDTTFDGKALSRSEHLDRIAEDAGVAALSSYVSFAGDDYGVFEEAGVDVPATAWFAAEDGLRTVRALIAGSKGNPADPVLAELQSLEWILRQAEHEKIRWHLAVDL